MQVEAIVVAAAPERAAPERFTTCSQPSPCDAAARWVNGSAAPTRAAGDLGPVPLLQLIGTRKGGTTALSDHLLSHPYLLKPDCRRQPGWPRAARSLMCVWDKEVRYFSRGFQLAGGAADQQSARASEEMVDMCWYRSLYPCVPAGAPHLTFDGSPDYLTMPEPKVAAMWLALGPRARLVALLRNPADRFYSAYNMGMNEAFGRSNGRGGADGRGASVGDGHGLRRVARRNRRELLGTAAGPARGGGRGGRRRGGWRTRRGAAWPSAGARELAEVDDGAAAAAAADTVVGGAEGVGVIVNPEGKGRRLGETPEQLTYDGFAQALPRYILCAPACAQERGPVHMFFDFGMYARHLAKFWRHFGRAQLLVLKSEDFYADAWPVVRQVLEFAGLPALDEVREAVAKGAANHNSGAKWGGKDYKAKLQPLERRLLHDYYAPHNKELYELLGRDMAWEAMGSTNDD